MLGCIILLISIKDLGRNLSPFPRPINNSDLVTTGIYRFTRHPMYYSLIFISIGVFIIKLSIYYLFLTISLALIIKFKIALEEKPGAKLRRRIWDDSTVWLSTLQILVISEDLFVSISLASTTKHLWLHSSESFNLEANRWVMNGGEFNFGIKTIGYSVTKLMVLPSLSLFPETSLMVSLTLRT